MAKLSLHSVHIPFTHASLYLDFEFHGHSSSSHPVHPQLPLSKLPYHQGFESHAHLTSDMHTVLPSASARAQTLNVASITSRTANLITLHLHVRRGVRGSPYVEDVLLTFGATYVETDIQVCFFSLLGCLVGGTLLNVFGGFCMPCGTLVENMGTWEAFPSFCSGR